MAENRIGYLIKGVQQAIRRSMDDELRPLNLSTSQYSTLSALEHSEQQSAVAREVTQNVVHIPTWPTIWPRPPAKPPTTAKN